MSEWYTLRYNFILYCTFITLKLIIIILFNINYVAIELVLNVHMRILKIKRQKSRAIDAAKQKKKIIILWNAHR